VAVAVGGIGLGVKVIVEVGGGKVAVAVGEISFEVEQAEGPKRSEKNIIDKIA
jgi:hypothetical protein